MDTRPRVTQDSAPPPWARMATAKQNNLLQAACRDLEQLTWGGFKLDQADWRHLISAAVKGVRVVPSLTGRGLVTLATSSMRLSRDEKADAITMAFHIGDAPWDYNPSLTTRVRWCDAVCIARQIPDDER